jgi:transcription antitermination factor NusG
LILELNDVENASYKEIETAIIMVFGDDIEYFIPIYHERMGSYLSTSVLMEGYVFFRDCERVRQKAANIREQKTLSRFLSLNNKFQTVSTAVINDLKKKLKNSLKRKFEEGASVRVLEGVFKNLIGEVIDVEDKGRKVMIRIKRISREIIAPIPATLLERVE